MNRGRMVKRMRRFICKYGVIDEEGRLPPDKSFRPFRKGSYFVNFDSGTNELNMSCAIGDVNKYMAYKRLAGHIKDFVKCRERVPL